MVLAVNVAALGDYGLTFDMDDLRQFVQVHLNKNSRHVPCFKDNLPGVEWGYGFLKRYSDVITSRHCQMRDKSVKHQAPQRKQVNVPAGSCVGISDLESASTPVQASTSGSKRQVRQRLVSSDDSNKEESSDVPNEEESNDDETNAIEVDNVTASNLKAGVYVLVRFDIVKKQPCHYVGKLKGAAVDDEWGIEFYKKCSGSEMNTGRHDVMFALPQPAVTANHLQVSK
jgi:hypothetical protein